jgi:hypothetical protein
VAGADAEGAVVLFYDVLADPEAEAGSHKALGGEEGIEDAGDDLCGDAGAGVRKGEDETGLACGEVCDLVAADEQAAAVGHGVKRVGDEVVEDLTDLAFKADDGAGDPGARLYLDAGVEQASEVQAKDVGDEFFRGDGGGFGGLAIKAQGLAGDEGDAPQLKVRHVQVMVDVMVVLAAASKVQEVGNGLQRVVDLMRDAAGEAAYGGDLLALDEGVFSSLLRGDFKRGRGDGLDCAVLRKDREVIDGPVTVFAGLLRNFAFQQGVAKWNSSGGAVKHLSQPLNGGNLCKRPAEDLLLGEADNFSLSVVEAEVAVVDGIKEGEANGGGAVDRLKLGGLALQNLLLAFQLTAGDDLFCYVKDHIEDAVDDSAGIAGGLVDEVKVARGALVGGGVDEGSRGFAAKVRDARVEDLVEKLKEALALKLRKSFPERLAEEVILRTPMHEGNVAVIDERDSKLWAGENEDGCGCLEEEAADAFPFNAGFFSSDLRTVQQLRIEEAGGDAVGEFLRDGAVFLREGRGVDGAAEGEGAEGSGAGGDGDGEQRVEGELAHGAEVSLIEGDLLTPLIRDGLHQDGDAALHGPADGVVLRKGEGGAGGLLQDDLLGGVAVDPGGALHGAVWVEEVKVTEIREGADAEAGDGFQRGVEVLGAGKDQAGLRKEFQVALCAAALRNVAEDENDAVECAGGVMDGGAGVVNGDFRAVAAEEQGMVGEADDGAEAANLVDGGFDNVAGLFMDDAEDVAEGAADGVGLGPAGEGFGDWVHEDDLAGGLAGDDGVADTAEEGGEPDVAASFDEGPLGFPVSA